MAKDATSANGRRPMKHFLAVMVGFWEAAILAGFTNDDERNRYFKGTMLLEEIQAIKRRAENFENGADDVPPNSALACQLFPVAIM